MPRRRIAWRAVAAVAAAAALAGVSPALRAQQSASLVASRDATLIEDAQGALANGSGSYLFAGVTGQPLRQRALVAFDVAAALPAGARVLTAELRMNVSRSTWTTPLPASLHRVSTPWTEGPADPPATEGQGTTASAGDATWVHASAPAQPWNAPGGDAAAAASAVASTPMAGAAIWSSTAALVADVQGWLDAPASNHGWLVRTEELGPFQVRRFDSRTNGVLAQAPTLVLTFVAPGQWSAVGAGCGAPPPVLAVQGTIARGGTVTFALTAQPGGALAALCYDAALAPAGVEPLPGCAFWLPVRPGGVVNSGLRLLDASGATQDTFAIPNQPAFAGFLFAGQGGVLAGNAPWFSNAAAILVP